MSQNREILSFCRGREYAWKELTDILDALPEDDHTIINIRGIAIEKRSNAFHLPNEIRISLQKNGKSETTGRRATVCRRRSSY